MPACVHGDVCRAWMKKYDTPFPLHTPCPSECPHFKEKKRDCTKCKHVSISEPNQVNTGYYCFEIYKQVWPGFSCVYFEQE